MTEESRLVLAVDSTQVKAGGVALDDLARAGGKAEVATGALTKANDILANAVKGLVSAYALWKVYDYIKDSALLAARYETLGVSMKVVGQNAGYTGAQMESSAVAMQKAGISMIESRQQAIRLVQAHIDLASSTKLARIAQDAAVIGNMNSSEAFASMIHGIQTGQTEVLRTIGLNISMEQSYKTYADTLGKTEKQLTQNEKTQAILNAVMLAGAGIAGTYEAAMDTAGKQMNSMTRYTEDFKVMLGGVFNEALTVGVMAYTDKLKDTNKEMSDLTRSGDIKEWADGVATAFAYIVDAAVGVLGMLKIIGATTIYIGETAANFVKAGGNLTMMREYQKETNEVYGNMVGDILSNLDPMRAALEKRQDALAQTAAKTLADTKANESEHQRILAFYTAQREKGLMDEVAYVKVMKAYLVAAYGDNHSYDNPAAVAPKISVAKVADEYAKLSDAIQKQLATVDEQLKYGDKLTAGQKLEIGLMHDIEQAYQDGKLSLKGYNQLTDDSIKLWGKLEALDRVRAEQELAKAVEQSVLGMIKSYEETLKQAKAEEARVAKMGLTVEQLGILRVAEIDVSIAQQQRAAMTPELSAIELQAIELQIEALKRLRQAALAGPSKQADLDAAKKTEKDALDAAKKVAEEWKHGWEETDRIAREAFTGWAENGKSMAETIGSALKKALLSAIYEATIRPIAMNIYASIVGGGGAGGAGGAVGAVGTGVNAYGAYTAISGSAFASGFTAGASIGTEAFGAGVTMMTEATGVSSFMAGAGQTLGAMGPVGWIALVVIAAYAVFHKEFISATDVGSAGIRYDAQGNQTQVTNAMDMPGNALALQTVNNLGAAYLGYARQLGINPGDTTFQFQANTGREGANPNFTMQGLRNGTTSLYQTQTDNPSLFGANEVAMDPAHLQLETSRVILSALQSSELPKSIKGVFDGLVPASMDQAQLDTALQTAQAFADLHTQLQLLPFAALKDMSYAAAAALVTFSGGMQQFGTNLATYYSKFYSPDEQRAQSIVNVNATVAGAGVTGFDAGTATREFYRSLVESQDLTTTSGQQAYAALISVAGAFDQIHPLATAAAAGVAAVGRSLADIASERTGLQNQLDQLTMTSAQLLDRQRNALDASNVSLFDQVQAAQAAKDAADALAQAQTDAAAAATALAATNKTWQDQLDVLTGAQTDHSIALRDAGDASTRALMEQVYALQDLKTAADAAAAATQAAAQTAAALAKTNQGVQDQIDILTGTQTARSLALRDATDETTRALLSQLYAQQDLKAASDAAAAAAAAATAFAANLAAAQTSAYSDLFAANKTAYDQQQSDANAAAQAQQQAAQATQQAATAIRDAFASAGQGIADFIKTLHASIATQADLAATYKTDLVLAQGGDLEASKRIPGSGKAYLDSQISNATTAFDATKATALMANELGALPAVKTYQDKLLEAVQGVTGAVGGTTAAVVDLHGKFMAELTLSARSEIVKLLDFIVDDTKMTPETKALALLASGSVSRIITLAATSLLKPQDQELALMVGSDILKTITLATANNDPLALSIAFAQSGAVERIITASGGILTPDQAALLSAVDDYNKTITLHVAVDPASLSATQTLINTVFGSIDIGAIGTSTGLGGVDLTAVLGDYGLQRLTNIRAFLSTLDWGVGANASAHTAYAMAGQYGVTELDIANAMGYHLADIQAVFDSAGIPRFDKGVNYLPSDMIAQVHKGETITPAPYVDMERSAREETNALLRRLQAEVASLRSENSAENRGIIASTNKTFTQLRQAMPDGDALATRAVTP